VGNKIEDLLSRIAALEARFATLPGNVEEQRRRYELIRYLLSTFKTTKRYSGFSKIYGRPSPTTRFVRDLGTRRSRC
jgi:hypothetical protein